MKRSFATLVALLVVVAGGGSGARAGQEKGNCYNIGIGDVDVLLLLDDTGSFAGYGPQVQTVFSDVVSQAQAALPSASLAFGVARFEEYASFAWEYSTGRPFILNEPVTTNIPSVTDALDDVTPGYGGDGPETDIEALHQVATGAGLDGNGNGTTADSGPAGNPGNGSPGSGYLTPGDSGDVPAYSGSGLGGADWRPGARHLVILATDIGSVSPFPSSSIPATITGLGGTVSVASSAFDTGWGRFGQVGGSVSPSNGATVQATINELNALAIRVIGLVPGGTPQANPTGPSLDPSVLASALGILTGAVNTSGLPLVFDLGATDPTPGLVNAIVAGAQIPILEREANAEAFTAGGAIVTPGPDVIINKPNQTVFPSGGSMSTLEMAIVDPQVPVKIYLGAGRTSTSGTETTTLAEATARTEILGVKILDSATNATLLAADVVVGASHSRATQSSRSSDAGDTQLAGLNIGGNPASVAVPANTVIPIPGGAIILNEQIPLSTPTSSSLVVTPIHVLASGGGASVDVAIGTAYTAAACKSMLPGDPPTLVGGNPIQVEGVPTRP
ncbi:MAG: hypothetical protein HY775_13350 [Acidobacteria bacterium]|nr:hypothetical protein [Acidobacteriota bacterium]